VAAAVDLLSRAQIALGHEVEVACLDEPGSSWLADRPYHIHAFRAGPFRGYGWCPALARWLREHAPRFDAVTVEGIWQYHGPAARAAALAARVPYFVYPHGMLDPWFQRAYPWKHVKKMIYWRLAEARVLRDARAVVFTAEEEMQLAKTSFRPWHARAVVAPLGVTEPGGDAAARVRAWQARYPNLADRRFLLYLGRLDPKKGADLLLTAYAAVYSAAARNARATPALVLAGPETDSAFVARCRALAGELGLRDGQDVIWTGHLETDLKWAALEAADALVLPSHQENFGYVVAEALAVGTPVLLSERVNIWREVVNGGAGLAAPDDAAGTRQLLVQHAAWTPAVRAQFSAAARACYAEHFDLAAAAHRQIEIFSETRE
jgi:glycosyltransferase involved in cell wall biosynthesis